MSDVVADVLGITVGSWMMMELLKQRYRNRRQVNFSSSAKKQRQNHIILFRNSNQETKPPQTQVKINKDHASFLFEQNDDDDE
ncbi:MAG: hypothetical protein P9L94_10410 [Candidatus Hinthialibacter antarcticus]|nr:hypothetical protein [Candidatus Hinthialibacter antarcticus]